MSYEKFAYIYDELMQDVPYEKWVDFVIERLAEYGCKTKGSSLLDLGCGTGELSIRFSQQGFSVTGVDLSADMLAVARTKAEESGYSIPFYEQNMAELEGLGQYDLIGIFCDSLNYLTSEEEVTHTFSKVFNHLTDKGIFIFDVHSVFKINQIFADQTFTFNGDRLAYIWDCFPGDFPDSVEHELSFFVLDKSCGKYDRFDELHRQRTFSVNQYTGWLQKAGFEIIEITADFVAKPPQPQSERIFFIAKKNKEKN